ncbi:MAG: cation transporter, partial [Spirochaetia bacterium]
MKTGRHPQHGGGHEYGQAWSIAAALLDGPRTYEELLEYYRVMARRFGVFVGLWERGGGAAGRNRPEADSPLRRNLSASLELLLGQGWTIEENGRYHITEAGRAEAEKMLGELERTGRTIERATRPETVSAVTLLVHFALASVKLPAAILSGSVGLLNDALDTLADGVSSLFVFLGVRSGRERLVSYLFVVFMGAAGLFSLYESVRRLIRPAPLTVDSLAVTAVVLSGVVCALLWLYQKYCGLKHGSMPLIAQSVDSRNHVIVAGGVGAGLIAAVFDLSLLDRLVGLTVAVLILRGAVELLTDLIRSAGEEKPDLSRWGFSAIEARRHRQTVRWLLYEIDSGRIHTRDQMMKEARAATDFSRIASFRALGIDEQTGREEKLERAASEVFERGLAVELGESPGLLTLTETGRAELDRALSRGPAVFTPGEFAGAAGPGEAGVRRLLLRGLGLALRFGVSAVVFTAVHLLAGWVISWLPELDVWAPVGGSRLLHAPALTVPGLRSGEALSFAQVVLLAAGLILFHLGRMLAHRARHILHHATEHRNERTLFLATTGPYASRRHPHAAGLILSSVGIAVGLHSVYLLVWAALVGAAHLAAGDTSQENKASHLKAIKML